MKQKHKARRQPRRPDAAPRPVTPELQVEPLRRLNRALRVLSTTSQILIRATQESDLLQEICRIAVEVGDYRLAWVGYAEQDDNKTVRPVAQAGFEDGYLETLRITWADAERGRGPTGTAIRTGKPSIARDMRTEPRFAPWRAEATRHGYASSIALPLIANSRTFGTLNIYATEPDAFDTEEVKLLTELANDLAYGITALRTHAAREQADTILRIQRDLSLALSATHNLEEGLGLCLDAALRVSDMDCGGFYLADATSEALDMVFHKGLPPDFVKSASHYDADSPNTRLVMVGKPIYTEHLRLGVPLDEAEHGEGLRAIAILPLHHKDRVIGCLNVASHTLHTVPAISRVALETIAAQICSAIARLQTEEALRREHDLLAHIAETSPAGITLVNREGQITFANARAEKVLGLTKDEITQRTYNAPGWQITDYDGNPFPDEDLPFRRVMATGKPVFDVRHAIGWQDGRRVLLSINAAPLLDASGQVDGMVATVEDITERVHAQEALERAYRDWVQIFQAIGHPTLILDPEYNIIAANQAAVRATGLSMAELAHKKCYQVFHGTDRPPADCPLARLCGSGRMETEDMEVVALGGVYSVSCTPVFDEKGQLCKFIHIATDITERKKAEELIKRERDFSEFAINAMPGVFYIFDENCKFLRWNRNLETVTEYSAQEIARQTPFDLLREDCWELVATRMQEVFSKGRAEVEVVFVSKSVKEMPYYCQGHRIVLDGTPYLIGTGIDISERKRAEEALRKSEDRYRVVADMISDYACSVRVEPDNNLVWEWETKPFSEITGFTSEEVLARGGAHSIIHPDDAPNVPRIDFNNPEPTVKEYRIVTKGGAVRWHRDYQKPVWDETQGRVVRIYGVTQDITERKRAEEALRISEERYRMLVENANEAIVVAQDCVLKYANPKAIEITGYSKEELTSQPFVGFIHPDDRAMVVERHLARLKGDKLADVYPFRIVSKGGDTKWVEINAVLITWDGRPATLNFLSDITERKRAEEALCASEERFRFLAENAQDMIYRMSLPDGRYEYVSPAATRILGYSPEELYNSPRLVQQVIHPDWRGYFESAWADLTKGILPPTYEYRIIHKSGETRWLNQRNALIKDARGTPIAIQGIVTDITERRRAEEALKESEKQYRILIEQSVMGIGLSKGNQVVFANSALLRIFGYDTLEEFAKISLLDQVAPSSREMIVALMREVSQGGTRQADFEYDIIRKDGKTRTLHAHTSHFTLETKVSRFVNS